jgi:pyruvate,water dikinase
MPEIKEKEANIKEKYIRWFSEIGKEDVKLVGGKAANLGEMLSLSLPVPQGFAITSEAYSYFLKETGLDREIYEMLKIDVENTVELEEIAKKIRKMIIEAEMPANLEEEIIEAYEALSVEKSPLNQASSTALAILKMSEPAFVAVRSSATAEDTKAASFAGQQETFLNVKGKIALTDSVKKCFASLFTARSIYYRIKKGFRHEQVLNAVIVQIMVDSDKSGVIFSHNPITRKDNIVIEAVFGLGEGIVSGKIKPDYYLVSRDLKILEKKTSNKKIAIVRKSSGEAEEVKLNELKSKEQVLSNYEIKRLADYALKLEEHYKIPQDIEFAISAREIYIVQTRPVTTLGQEVKKEKVEGKELLGGLAASPGIGSGKVKIVRVLDDLAKIEKNDVLVTKMTNPDMVVIMQKSSAIVTDEGGLTSHAAIVSREMGIPAVVGTRNATQVLKDGVIITVDGFSGKVYEGGIEELRKRGLELEEEKVVVEPVVDTRTKIKIIVDLPSFARRAAKTGIKEVGLVRIEGIIAESGKHPNLFLKENKLNEYEEIIFNGINKIAGHFNELWIRTSDIRTDEYRNLEGSIKEIEANPMLGMHGIRAGLKNKEILKAELRAMKKLAEKGKKVGVLLPQIISVDEVREAKEILREIENLELGVMIETPASVEIIEHLCKEISFISFGTNDLTQYTLAVDRGNIAVQDLYDEMHPAVLSQLEKVIRTCKKYGVETSICGQAGSNKKMVEFLVKSGIDSISVNADKAAEISKFVKELEEKGLRGSALREAETEEKESEEKVEEKREGKAEKVGKDKIGRGLYNITCDRCGREAEVPFKPKPNKSVYCRECWKKIKEEKKGKDLKEKIIEKDMVKETKEAEESFEEEKEEKEKQEDKKQAEKGKEEKQGEWQDVKFGFDVLSSQQKTEEKAEEDKEKTEEELKKADEEVKGAEDKAEKSEEAEEKKTDDKDKKEGKEKKEEVLDIF